MSLAPETDNFLFDVDAEAMAAQILGQEPPPGPAPVPAQGGESAHLEHALQQNCCPTPSATAATPSCSPASTPRTTSTYQASAGTGGTPPAGRSTRTTPWSGPPETSPRPSHLPTPAASTATSPSTSTARRRALSTLGIRAMLTQAKTTPGMVLRAELLDADPYTLSTPAGIVDLHAGLIRTPQPDKDFNSRSTSTGPQQQATPRWDRFLTDAFGENAEGKEMIDFLHLMLGYSITGDVGAQVTPFLFGSGKNGKSVLLDVLMKLLGDYADAARPGFLMARTFGGHPTELAELHERRVIVCSEVKPGDKLDEARVKLLTGGDRIKARPMRQDFFSFEPAHQLWLSGNHRPEVATGGFAFRWRMRLVPFEKVVSDDRKIDNLVTEEGPGILAWLIDGARRYLAGEKDLSGPAPVRIATTAYAETEDHTGRFFEECCTFHTDHRAEQARLRCHGATVFGRITP